MSDSSYTLTAVSLFKLEELAKECEKHEVAKGATAFENILRLIVKLHEKKLFVENDMALAAYARYVLDHKEDFVKRGCKRAELPIVFATLHISQPVTPLLVYPPTQYFDLYYINVKRKQYEPMIIALAGSANPTVLKLEVLHYIFKYINESFFEGVLPAIKFTVSKKLTASGAYFQARADGNKIAFSAACFNSLFADGKKEAMASGLRCSNRIQWLQYVMEHEMIHYFIWFSKFKENNPMADKSIVSSHGLLFLKLAEQMFRHKSICCETDDTAELATITKDKVRHGMTVTFRFRDGTLCTAKVKRINPKTVTVEYGVGRSALVCYSLLLSCGFTD